MSYRALTQIMQGADPVLEPGDEIPATFLDIELNEQPNDFERLVELGAAEKVETHKAAAKAAHSKPAPKAHKTAKE